MGSLASVQKGMVLEMNGGVHDDVVVGIEAYETVVMPLPPFNDIFKDPFVALYQKRVVPPVFVYICAC